MRATLWPWIGDVAGLIEDIEIVHKDEYPSHRFQIYPVGPLKQINDWRYSGPVLALSTTAPFDTSSALKHLRRSAWSFGTDIHRADATTIIFFVHPDAEHHRPANPSPEEWQKLLAELRRRQAQHCKARPDGRIEVVCANVDRSKFNG
jgi:hypothetical protein